MALLNNIRRARLVDLDRLTEISIRSKQSNGYDEQFMQSCRDELTVRPEHLTKSELWIATVNGDDTSTTADSIGSDDPSNIGGLAAITIDRKQNAAEIESFFIDPKWQRRGLGRALWGKLHQRAITHGVTEIFLDADPAAVAFYEALGFKTMGSSPSGSIPGRSLPRMSRVIN